MAVWHGISVRNRWFRKWAKNGSGTAGCAFVPVGTRLPCEKIGIVQDLKNAVALRGQRRGDWTSAAGALLTVAANGRAICALIAHSMRMDRIKS